MTTLARIVSVLVVGLLVLTGAVAVAAVARSDDPARDRVTVTEQVREQTRQATQTQERDRTDLDRDRQRVRLHERDCTQDCNDRTPRGHAQPAARPGAGPRPRHGRVRPPPGPRRHPRPRPAARTAARRQLPGRRRQLSRPPGAEGRLPHSATRRLTPESGQAPQSLDAGQTAEHGLRARLRLRAGAA